MYRQKISGQHKDYPADEGTGMGCFKIAKQGVNSDPRKHKMEDDKPVPYHVEGQEEVENMGRVEYPRLEGSEKRHSRKIVGVPQRELSRLYKRYPEKFGGNEKGGEIPFNEYCPRRQHRPKIPEA
jgi:hypothetical protein